jgi:hypothetical protein
MSYLCEKRTWKYTRRTANTTSYYRWPGPMEFDAHEDATFRYTNIETANNASALYPRWEYNTLLNAYFEIIPVIRANTVDSNSAFNSWASEGNMMDQALAKESATLFRFYNKATNTSSAQNGHVPLKGYSLLDKGKIAWYGVQFQVSATSDTTFKATDNTGGGIFHLPIAENQ